MKRIPPPETLEEHVRKDIRTWFVRTYPHAKINMQNHWEDCRDYYLMQGDAGNQLDWGACFRRWLRRGQTPRQPYQEPRRGSSERPQESRDLKGSEMIPVTDIFKDLSKKKN